MKPVEDNFLPETTKLPQRQDMVMMGDFSFKNEWQNFTGPFLLLALTFSAPPPPVNYFPPINITHLASSMSRYIHIMIPFLRSLWSDGTRTGEWENYRDKIGSIKIKVCTNTVAFFSSQIVEKAMKKMSQWYKINGNIQEGWPCHLGLHNI